MFVDVLIAVAVVFCVRSLLTFPSRTPCIAFWLVYIALGCYLAYDADERAQENRGSVNRVAFVFREEETIFQPGRRPLRKEQACNGKETNNIGIRKTTRLVNLLLTVTSFFRTPLFVLFRN